jgi:hypothetical protein
LAARGKLDDVLTQLDAAMMPQAMELAVKFGLFEPEGAALTEALMRRWGALDPDVALRFAAQYGAVWGGTAARHVLSTAPEFDPEWAHLASAFPVHDAATFLSALWAELDAEATSDWSRWVAALPAGTKREAAIEALAGQWGRVDPEEAILWLQQQDAQGQQPQAYRRLADAWSATDPLAALQWANSLNGNMGQGYAQRAILTAWAARDPEAAFRHLISLPASPEANDFRYWFVEAAVGVAPSRATQMLTRITDPALRAHADALSGKRGPHYQP